MPARGWKKEDGRESKIYVRVSDTERKLLEKTARKAGYRNLSTWLRELGLAEAGELLGKKPAARG
jgi:hypothetical protein